MNNSITALYSSIFACAAFADVQAKDKRRQEWKDKIAAVKEEVIELMDEEKRIVAALSSRYQPCASDRLRQARQYSTFSGIPSQWQQLGVEGARIGDSSIAPGAEVQEDAGAARTTVEEEKEEADVEEEDMDEDGHHFELDNYDTLTIRAMQMLSIKALAIRLLLRPLIAREYLEIKPKDASPEFALPQPNIPELLKELRKVRQKIHSLREAGAVGEDEMVTEEGLVIGYETTKSLDDMLARDVALYMESKMALPELLLRLSNNLLLSKEPNRLNAFRIMILALSKTRQNDIVELIIRTTLLPFGFTLNSGLIITILSHFRKARDLQGFDRFCSILQGDTSYKPNLGGLPFYRREVVNGVEITVPPLSSNNVILWQSFIISALRFNQPERADAWGQSARAHGVGDSAAIVQAYLRFYVRRKDWKGGVDAMKRAIAFISASHFPDEQHVVERVIALMVLLCDTCEQYEFSEAVINAAVESGFDQRCAESQLDISFSYDPAYERWERAAKRVGEDNSELEERETWERCHTFTSIIREKVDFASRCEGDRLARRQAMSHQHWDDHLSSALSSFDARSETAVVSLQNSTLAKLREHDQEVGSLRAQVAHLKSMVADLCQTKARESTASSTIEGVNPMKTSHALSSPQEHDPPSSTRRVFPKWKKQPPTTDTLGHVTLRFEKT